MKGFLAAAAAAMQQDPKVSFAARPRRREI